ncbi:DUF1990 domain-containing protein [Actinospica durhamensis]|uniref:DUF1990 domain-containing protein n=1 Tax=Actinospica durhamensis TaxID=1508375 RepID=A0A941ERG1_9ACTN|nr:DUF1990 domain-containing protein [Actinospica durhamensis]MBR7832444.1 DUF1990 domain-containing protein [Actinospica durhamensis]
MSGFTYPEVGTTRGAGPPPSGYRYLEHRMRVGTGERAFAVAGEAVLDWRLHAGMHVRPRADRARAEPGARVTVRLGLTRPAWLGISAPCEVVWAVDEPRRRGFAYGTLRGHPERGEEMFLVEWDGPDDGGPSGGGPEAGEPDQRGAVWLTVRAFSVGAKWYTRAAGPLVPLLQHSYALTCGVVLRRLTRSAASTDE